MLPHEQGAPAYTKKAIESLPFFSVASLVLVSVFNIGYFANIGLHFLGLIDFTNMVYSIGLVFGGLILFINIFAVAIDVILRVSRNSNNTIAIERWLACFAGGVIAIATLLLALPHDYQPITLTVGAYFVLLFAFLFLWSALNIALQYRRTQSFRFRDITLCLFALVSADLSLGKAVADSHITQQTQFYTIATKSGVLTGVILVRSSSNGFIVARNGAISFLSKDEVKSISSEQSYSFKK
jgi:hypothetical protein